MGGFFEDLVEQIAQFGCLPEKQNQMFVVSSIRLEILDCSSGVFFVVFQQCLRWILCFLFVVGWFDCCIALVEWFDWLDFVVFQQWFRQILSTFSQHRPWRLSHWSLSCSAHDKVDQHSNLSTHSSSSSLSASLPLRLFFLILIFTMNNLVKQHKITVVLKMRLDNDFAERWKTRATTEGRPRTICRMPRFQTSVLGFRR